MNEWHLVKRDLPQCGLLRAFFKRRSPHCGRGRFTVMGLARGAGSYGARFIVDIDLQEPVPRRSSATVGKCC
jgi:hypothetical protein